MTAIPAEIKEVARCAMADGYANIFDLLSPEEPKRLYGTESLCGDWNAHTIVLGKDFASAQWLEKRKEEDPKDPYRHDPTFETNVFLEEILRENGIKISLQKIDEKQARNCGVFYMNACFLLRTDGKNTGNLKNKRLVMHASRPVFECTLKRLKRAKRIICMGRDAYDFACNFDKNQNWRNNLRNRIYVDVIHGDRKYQLIPSSHLGALGRLSRLPKGSGKAACINAITEDWKQALKGEN